MFLFRIIMKKYYEKKLFNLFKFKSSMLMKINENQFYKKTYRNQILWVQDEITKTNIKIGRL